MEPVNNNATPAATGTVLDAGRIMQLLPHRYPFLLVDKIVHLEPGRAAVGIKNVTINEPFFAGHFPGRPVMPGVLILEALAQVGAVCALAAPGMQGKLLLFAGIDRVRFRRPVVPGDVLRLSVEVVSLRAAAGKCRARAEVGGELAAQAELMFVAATGK
ncbi:MAG: 3-hydroxyacyl-ACP dehydratase FabZ [Desulfurispora sp.]|uniref:3-hydroxyacyl-ACP dehydratase FabZ n=1 Tax=Desulfurispora sp. TaxID=3014275 RepID=UPI00404A086D